MSATLALPEYVAAPAGKPESRPAKLASWLDRLPGDDGPRAARDMADALATLNRTPLAPKTRREIADLFQERGQRRWPQLEQALRTATHPLVGESLDVAKAAIALAGEINIAVKRCLADEIDRPGWTGASRELPALIHRCQMAAGRALSISYLAYAPVPEGTWHDLHAIYQVAVERGLAKAPVNPASPALTPELGYIQTMLLALANPYGLLPGELGLVVDFIGEYGSSAVLTGEPPVHRHAKAVSIVPVGYDFPPFSANKGGSAEGKPLYLLTFELAFSLQERLRALDRGAVLPTRAGTGPVARRRYVALLKKLLREWGDPPVRHLNRLPSRAEVAICFGMSLVWQVTRSIRDPEAVSRQAVDPASALKPCRVTNQTPGGYALRLAGEVADALALRVGEMIGVRVRNPDRWQVGSVRWFRNSLRDNSVELGCEVLSETAEPAAVRAESAPPDAGSLPALHLAADQVSGVSLILPAGAFDAETGILIRRGQQAVTGVLTKMVEQTPAFDRYEYVAVP